MIARFEKKIYGLTELGKKSLIGTQRREINGAMPVGGKIFYVDPDDNGATYTFYDVEGDEIPIADVIVGTTPHAYVVDGTPSKDKFYVFNNQLLTSKVWTYKNGDNWVLELLGTKTAIGEGRNNTDIVMAADDGAYVDWANSIWHFLDIANTTDKPGGCDDWFIGSKDEIDKLRLAVDADGNPLVNWFINNTFWTSTENNAMNSVIWYSPNLSWYGYGGKGSAYGVFWTRAF